MPIATTYRRCAVTLLILSAWAGGSGAQGLPSGTNGPGGGATQQGPVPGSTGGGSNAAGEPSPGEPGFTTGLFSPSRSNLLGDLYGVRPKLGNYGVSLGLSETSEVFGNATGGVHRGAAYDGLTQMSLGLDTNRAFGWEGGTFNVSAFQIHGRNLSSDNLYTLQTASGIEANRATRLWELWYQQAFFSGRADVKIGQQSLDQEFINSQGSGLFINTMMGWPLIPSVDLYAGGPAYPLSSLGVRFRAQPTGNLTVLAGVFNDNPPGGPFDDDSQVRGAEQSGSRFNFNTGALFIAELQYAFNQPALGQLDRGEPSAGLPGTYKIGAWFDTGQFPDQRRDALGSSLADPNGTGNPKLRRHNYSIYGVADQALYVFGEENKPRSINVFARLMGAPGDRNLAEFSVNAGITVKGPFPERDIDSFGLGFGVAKVSRTASLLDKDSLSFNGYAPVRSAETFIELTYQYVAAPWLTLQPDFQYVWLPSGGIANPLNSNKRIGNEAIFGVRTNIVF